MLCSPGILSLLSLGLQCPQLSAWDPSQLTGSACCVQGVMMSHGNLVATIAAVMAVVPNYDPSDVYFAYLPLAHVLELAAEVSIWIRHSA